MNPGPDLAPYTDPSTVRLLVRSPNWDDFLVNADRQTLIHLSHAFHTLAYQVSALVCRSEWLDETSPYPEED